MSKWILLSGVALLAGLWGAQAMAISCDAPAGAAPLPVRTTPVPPLFSGLQGRPAALATPRTLLAESRDESLALDVVLMRLRLETCAAQPANEYANYVPKTAHDNTPYRFNMEKGKKFTAAEFDAWMKSRGVRIVPARPAGEAAGTSSATAAPNTATVSD